MDCPFLFQHTAPKYTLPVVVVYTWPHFYESSEQIHKLDCTLSFKGQVQGRHTRPVFPISLGTVTFLNTAQVLASELISSRQRPIHSKVQSGYVLRLSPSLRQMLTINITSWVVWELLQCCKTGLCLSTAQGGDDKHSPERACATPVNPSLIFLVLPLVQLLCLLCFFQCKIKTSEVLSFQTFKYPYLAPPVVLMPENPMYSSELRV